MAIGSAFPTYNIGLYTTIDGSVPMNITLSAVDQSTTFRFNCNSAWMGSSVYEFAAYLGSDPKYKKGMTKATVSTPSGVVTLSWTATTLTFKGYIIDGYNGIFGPPPLIPVGVTTRFTAQTHLLVKFQSYTYYHVADLIGTNSVQLIVYQDPLSGPAAIFGYGNRGGFTVTTDLIGPVVTINSPKSGLSITNDNLNVKFTVTDDVGLTNNPGVGYHYNGNDVYIPANVDGLKSFTATAGVTRLIPGTNTILFDAYDSSGNYGSNTFKVFYSVKTPIALTIIGSGTVSGVANGQLLEIGRNYSMTAHPGPGKIFAGWSNPGSSAFSYASTLNFAMNAGLSLVATFIDSPYRAVKGDYFGPAQTANAPALAPAGPSLPQLSPATCGAVKVTVGDLGSFSGTVTGANGTAPFSGVFNYDPSGVEQGRAQYKSGGSTNTILLTLQTVAGNPGFGTVTGILASGPGGIAFHEPNVFLASATFTAFEVQTNATSLPAGATVYNFFFSNLPNEGFSFGTIKVSANGTILGSLTLADNIAPVPITGSLVLGGKVVLYASLYNKSGMVLGTFDLSQCGTSGFLAPAGTMNWIKPPGLTIDPTGFNATATIIASKYIPPSSAIDYPNSYFTWFDQDTRGAQNKVKLSGGVITETPVDSVKVSGTFTYNTGACSGTFVENGVTRKFKGIGFHDPMLNGLVYGFFVRSTDTGFCEMTISP